MHDKGFKRDVKGHNGVDINLEIIKMKTPFQ